jgi:hypothetical protein
MDEYSIGFLPTRETSGMTAVVYSINLCLFIVVLQLLRAISSWIWLPMQLLKGIYMSYCTS